MSRGDERSDGRVVLLAGLIDDAALFPPARLDMGPALQGHARHRSSPHAWMVGRFVCPVSRLDALAQHLAPTESVEVSAVLDGAAGDGFADGVRRDLQRLAGAEVPGRIAVGAVEVRLPVGPETAAIGELVGALLAAGLAERVQVYAEITVAGRPPAEVASAAGALAAAQRRLTDRARGTSGARHGSVRASADSGRLLAAKVRCGGETPDAVPSPQELAAFLFACGRARVPFKATAGLHHPHPRIVDGRVAEHGFLRVLAANALVADAVGRARRQGSVVLGGATGHGGRPPQQEGGLGLDAVAAVLSAPEPSAVVFTPDGLHLGDRLLPPALLAETRASFLAIGSCSIDEPVEDLAALGVLKADGALA